MKIIMKNIDRKNCFIYTLSAALYAAVIFVLLSLLNFNNYLNIGYNSENAKIIFIFYYILLTTAGLIFMFYSLKYYTNTRMKTYGLLVVLGISRKKVIKIIILEFFFILVSSVVIGIIFGYILIQIICFTFLLNGTIVRIFMQEVLSNIFITIAVSCTIFILTCIVFTFKFLRRDLSKVMIMGIKKEYSYHFMSLAATVGITIIIATIYMLNNPTFLEIIIYLTFCLFGFYLLLKYGLGFILGVYKEKFHSNYTQNFFTINNLLFKYKSNVTIVYITFFLNFIIIFIVGGIIITTTIKEEYSSMYPYETVIVDYENFISFNNLPLDTTKIVGYKGCFSEISEEKDNILAISQDDYNKLTNSNIELDNKEIIFILQQDLEDNIIKDFIGQKKIFIFDNSVLELVISDIIYSNVLGINIPNNYLLGIISQDIEINAPESNIYISAYEIKNIESNNNIEIFSRSKEISVIQNNNLILKISSYFLAIFTVVCSLGILFIKQISDIPGQSIKLSILKYLGMSKKSRENTIVKELRILICTPILLSNIVVWFFIRAELKRVGEFNDMYIRSFLLFQLILLVIQYLFYCFIKQYILKIIK